MLLLSQDYGKHLLGVEDLLQKHALVEADIAIQADRVRNVNSNAQKFALDVEGKEICRCLIVLGSSPRSLSFITGHVIVYQSINGHPPSAQVINHVTLR